MGRIKSFTFIALATLAGVMAMALWWHNSVFVLHGPEHGFLLTKPNHVRHSFYLPAFYVHVVTGSLVLLLGTFQVSRASRSRYPNLHRLSGKIYAFTVLTLTAPSGFVMSLYANGGVIAQLGFASLATLWWFFTLKGINYAMIKDWNSHRKFMLRSYALTFSAVTLRVYSFLFALAGFRGESVYHLIVWLCWVPSLVAIELYILRADHLMSVRTAER